MKTSSRSLLQKLPLMFLFIAFLLLLKKHLMIVFFPFQGGYREGMSPFVTETLLSGQNPFQIETLPATMNMYGIFYSLVVAPFAWLFSNMASSFVIHRSVTAALLLFLLAYMFRFANSYLKSSPLFISSVLILLYASFFQNGLAFSTLLSQPANLGMLLMIATCIIPWKFGFSWPSLIVAILFSILGFLTKPYFLFSLLPLGLYLGLFVSKRKCILFGMVGIVLLVLSAVVVQSLFPSYFMSTFYMAKAHYSPSSLTIEGKMSLKGYSAGWTHAFNQLEHFFVIYAPLCILLIASLFSPLFPWKKPDKFQINVFNLEAPLIPNCNLNYFLFFSLIGFFCFVMELGHNVGAWMQYLVQLVIPFVALYLFSVFPQFPINLKRASVILAGINILIFFSFGLIGSPFGFYKAPQGETYTQFWEKAHKIIDGHNTIFASPALNKALLDRNRKIHFTGHSVLAFYMPKAFTSDTPPPLTPENAGSKLAKKLELFRSDWAQKIRNQTFDMVIMDNQDLLYFEDEKKLLNQYYDKSDEFQLDMPIATQHWVLYFYTPKKSLPTN